MRYGIADEAAENRKRKTQHPCQTGKLCFDLHNDLGGQSFGLASVYNAENRGQNMHVSL